MITNDDLPDARIDRFVVGFNALARGCAFGAGRSVSAALGCIGKVTTPASKAADGYDQITIDLETEDDHPAGMMRLDIYTYRKGGDLIFGDRCSIEGNGLRVLRGDLGLHETGPVGIDGKTNIVGPMHSGPAATRQQLDLLEQAITYVIDALSSAFPGIQLERMWLRSAEASRDIRQPRAIQAMRILQHATHVGIVQRKWDNYRRIGEIDAAPGPTLRFSKTVDGPEEKVYAKGVDTLRFEVSCNGRKPVSKLVGATQYPFAGPFVRPLFLTFLNAALPVIDELVEDAQGALRGEASITEMLVALRALIERAAGISPPRGPVSADGQEVAVQALNALLSIGMFDAAGIPQRHAIRRELDSLCGLDGPLRKHTRRSVYCLNPRFAKACAVIRMPTETVARD